MADHTIKFTDQHVDKILDGDKKTTMRTVKKKNFVPAGVDATIPGTDVTIRITDVAIVMFGEDTFYSVGPRHTGLPAIDLKDYDDRQPNSITMWTSKADHPTWKDVLPELEGFDNIDDMLDWFNSRNYNLPQPFFLYRFKVVDR